MKKEERKIPKFNNEMTETSEEFIRKYFSEELIEDLNYFNRLDSIKWWIISKKEWFEKFVTKTRKELLESANNHVDFNFNSGIIEHEEIFEQKMFAYLNFDKEANEIINNTVLDILPKIALKIDFILREESYRKTNIKDKKENVWINYDKSKIKNYLIKKNIELDNLFNDFRYIYNHIKHGNAINKNEKDVDYTNLYKLFIKENKLDREKRIYKKFDLFLWLLELINNFALENFNKESKKWIKQYELISSIENPLGIF